MTKTTVADAGRDVLIRPSPVAMVWQGSGRPHDLLAVPGVLLRPGDLLVEVELTTICGSDLHTVLGHRQVATPVVLGSEQVGRVVAAGDHARAVDGSPIVVGMRVVWSVSVSCGQCDHCERGLPQKCRTVARYGHDRVHRGWELSGGFATHVQVRAGSAVVLVDEGTPAAVAAPASGATATVVGAIEAAEAVVPLDGTTVLVTGAGVMGLTATAVATDAGATVVVADPDPVRRRLALRFGAAAVADPSAFPLAPTGLSRALQSLGPSRPSEPLVALELSGADSAIDTAIGLLGTGGVLVLAGSVSPTDGIRLDPEMVVRRQLTVRGVHNYSGSQLERAIGYLAHARHRYPFSELVGQTLPLDRLDEALDIAATGAHPRVAVNPRVWA